MIRSSEGGVACLSFSIFWSWLQFHINSFFCGKNQALLEPQWDLSVFIRFKREVQQ